MRDAPMMVGTLAGSSAFWTIDWYRATKSGALLLASMSVVYIDDNQGMSARPEYPAIDSS